MIQLEIDFNFMNSKDVYISEKNEVIYLTKQNKIIIFEKKNLLFIFNFHPSQSFENYKVGTKWGN